MTSHPKTRSSSSMSSRRRGALTDHLAASDVFARLSGQADRLRQLQTYLDAILPAHLAPGTHIANLKQGKIVIHADSGAVAVKLRQMAPRLTEGFIQQGQEVIGIEVRVQPRRRFTPATRQKPPKILGARSKQSLTSLIAGLAEDSPVRRALEKLLRNA